ncbi:MAG: glycosyltransferase family 2 protein [Phycisphaeraceae bacterium]|nr:glycosyltransferase family 2 protein [Phycisphaeraceae bacterium]
MTDLSILIPAYDEAESLEPLHAELTAVLDALELEWEIIYIDDGSRDGTADVLDRISEQSSNVVVKTHPRNLGKSAVYMTGFQAAEGQTLLTLDGDGQDDPAEIPKLLERLEQDVDLVVGWKQGRFENEPGKALPSQVYNGLKNVMFGLHLHDSNCGFRAMKRKVAESLDLYGDLYRFLPELAHLSGYRVAEVPVNHRPRHHGVSKYGPRRFWTGLLDLLAVRFVTGYRHKPLHFFGTAGLLPVVLGGGLEIYVLIMKLAGDTFREHMAAMIVGVMLILLGAQLISIGLIGEMIRAIHGRRDDRPGASR